MAQGVEQGMVLGYLTSKRLRKRLRFAFSKYRVSRPVISRRAANTGIARDGQTERIKKETGRAERGRNTK